MSKELLRQALDALVRETYGESNSTYEVIDALRAALAAPEAEPVAWAVFHADGSAHIYQQREAAQAFGAAVPLYAAPQQAQPTGKAPCVRHCEATAFQIEIRELKRALEHAQPAPAVPISWDRLRILMDGIPTREEFIGGQRQQYVAKEAVMGWLYEGQLRAEREAAQSSAPAVREPLTDEQIDAISLRDGGVTYRQLARAVEQAHGIGTPGSAPAAPAVREPLTDEQIAHAIFEARVGHSPFKRDGSTSFRIARAIERAHGIGDSNG